MRNGQHCAWSKGKILILQPFCGPNVRLRTVTGRGSASREELIAVILPHVELLENLLYMRVFNGYRFDNELAGR